jgi:telomere length regulation protein
MEDLLRPVSQIYRKSEENAELLVISRSPNITEAFKSDFQCASPEDALEALRSQPGFETLISVLKYLRQGLRRDHAFDVLRPSPQAAQIVHVLVTEIVPNYWTVMKNASTDQTKNRDLDLLLSCLLSVTGINALLAFLKVLLQQAKNGPKGAKQSHSISSLEIVVDLLDHALHSEDQIKRIWLGTTASEDKPGKARALRQEFVASIASGKIVSLSAEAETLLREAGRLERPVWLADSKEYVRWLGNSLRNWVLADHQEDTVKFCAELFSRSLKLGHAGEFTNPL